MSNATSAFCDMYAMENNGTVKVLRADWRDKENEDDKWVVLGTVSSGLDFRSFVREHRKSVGFT